MPTPRPIIAASVGANEATSVKRATTRTRSWPATRPVTATTIGRPAAISEPKASSRMTIATRRPIAWDVSGPVPAESSIAPEPPTVSVPRVRVLEDPHHGVGLARGERGAVERDGGVGDGVVGRHRGGDLLGRCGGLGDLGDLGLDVGHRRGRLGDVLRQCGRELGQLRRIGLREGAERGGRQLGEPGQVAECGRHGLDLGLADADEEGQVGRRQLRQGVERGLRRLGQRGEGRPLLGDRGEQGRGEVDEVVEAADGVERHLDVCGVEPDHERQVTRRDGGEGVEHGSRRRGQPGDLGQGAADRGELRRVRLLEGSQRLERIGRGAQPVLGDAGLLGQLGAGGLLHGLPQVDRRGRGAVRAEVAPVGTRHALRELEGGQVLQSRLDRALRGVRGDGCPGRRPHDLDARRVASACPRAS